MWIVRITKTPIVNDFRSGYFPRKVRYKKDAKVLQKEIANKGGWAVIEKSPD